MAGGRAAEWPPALEGGSVTIRKTWYQSVRATVRWVAADVAIRPVTR